MQNKINILLLEDDRKLLHVTGKLLANDDCVIHAAASIAQARAIIKTIMPDLAILDIMLPDGCGRDFALELGQLCRAAIIFLTEKSSKEDKHAGLTAGAIIYIPKPYDPEELKLTVDNIVANMRKTDTPSRRSFLLNDAERETVRLAIEGEPIKNIAHSQNVTQVCIKTRLSRTYKKLGITGKNGYEKRKRLGEILGGYL